MQRDHPRQAGIFQPGRQRQRPDRGGDDRRDGAGGPHQVRHGFDRADLGQYRDRAGLCRGLARLPIKTGDAEIDVDRAAQDAGVSRRRDRADAGGAGHEGVDRDRRRAGADHAQCGDAAAVQEPRQSRHPSPHHGGGNLERHRRQYRLFRRRRRHRRHHHRRWPGVEAAQAGFADRCRRTRGKPGAVGRPALAAQDPGHRRRLCARHSRPFGDRRDRENRQLDRNRNLARAGAPGGHCRRHFLGRRDLRGAQIGRRPEAVGKTILAIVPSFSERYLSTLLFEESSEGTEPWPISRAAREP